VRNGVLDVIDEKHRHDAKEVARPNLELMVMVVVMIVLVVIVVVVNHKFASSVRSLWTFFGTGRTSLSSSA
jgi:hypothetical protein